MKMGLCMYVITSWVLLLYFSIGNCIIIVVDYISPKMLIIIFFFYTAFIASTLDSVPSML